MLDQVLAAARAHGASRVTGIRLAVGSSAGVVPDCVRFHFDQLKQGTCAAEAWLRFRTVELRLRCPKCGAEFAGFDDLCSCNAGAEVVSGQELTIESIEIE